MKTHITLYLLLFYSYCYAQPFTQNNDTLKKELSFQKRKSAFVVKEKINENTIWENPDFFIEFKGGNNAYLKFVSDNLDNNIPIINEAPKGKYKIVIDIFINNLGEIKNIKQLTKHGYGMEEEAIRVVKKTTQKWTPAIVNNTNVMSKKQLVFLFEVVDL